MSDSIQVTLSTDRVVVSLGEKTEVTAEIHNLSDVVEVFSIEVEGIPSDWYTLSVTSVSLFPGDKETIRLVVAPPVTTAAAAGSYSASLKVSSKRDATVVAAATFDLEIGKTASYEVELSPRKAKGRKGSFEVVIDNTGNLTDTYELEPADDECKYKFSRDTVRVDAGRKVSVDLKIEPSEKPLIRGVKSCSFEVNVRPIHGEVKSVKGQLECPAIPKWVLQSVSRRLRLAEEKEKLRERFADREVETVEAISGELDLKPRKDRGRKGSFDVIIANTGDATETYELEAAGDERCEYEFSRDTVRVDPGRQVKVDLTVEPKKKPLRGESKFVDFKVRATPVSGEARTVDGQLECPALLPKWAIPAMAGVAAVILIIVLVAVFAGGGGEPVDQTPPVIGDVTVNDVGKESATVVWTTDEQASSQVEYGVNTDYGSASSLDSRLVTEHSVDLSGLTAGTTYHFRIKSGDGAGNEAVSADGTFTTESAVTDTTPPVISGIEVPTSGVTQSSATITWTTDEAATSQVQYGPTAELDSTSDIDEDLVTSHSVELTGLSGGTTYRFRVWSKDAEGNEAVSAVFAFRTQDTADTEAPEITDVRTGDLTGSTAEIIWTTSEAATSEVEYGKTKAFGTIITAAESPVTEHSFVLTGLETETTYYFRIKAKDAAGNERVSGVFTLYLVETGPSVPELISPVDGAVFDYFPRTTTLKWTAIESADPVVYVLEIEWCSQDLECRPYDPVELSETEYTFDFIGAQPGRWRVMAKTDEGESDWSGWWYFEYTT